ncbi:MAG: hypothetical protein IKE28_03800 [Solobacterium sp.]|nr:hypothetical protein [Solobacterium sp.]
MSNIHDDIPNQELNEAEAEFFSYYFDMLKSVFDGCDDNSEEDIENRIMPRLLALKMVVTQFEAVNPNLSAAMDKTVESLREQLRSEMGFDISFGFGDKHPNGKLFS